MIQSFTSLARVSVFLLGAVLLPSASHAFVPASTERSDALAAQSLITLREYAASQETTTTPPSTSGCTLENAAVRREWTALTRPERLSYIAAVQCLLTLPSQQPDPSRVPGARSRYDDFVVLHVNLTQQIHNTANFLTWHRLVTWQYEQTLRSECNYTGTQPYWNWARTADDPLGSEIFGGSGGSQDDDESMSGNGVFAPHNCTAGRPGNCIPPGEGGGCVDSGPFKDMVVNIGPIAPLLAAEGVVAVAEEDRFGWNPRCLRRDISSWVSQRWTTEENVTRLIEEHDDIASFQFAMQGNYSAGDYGVHGGAHFTTGGEPGADIYNSIADPIFFLNHAMVDRVYWIWQNLNPWNRTSVVAGTITRNNVPPSRDGTLDDVLDTGILGPFGITLGQAQNTIGLTGAPFCYIYE